MAQYFYVDEPRDIGLQTADMFADAVRLHAMGISSEHFQDFAAHITDLWSLL